MGKAITSEFELDALYLAALLAMHRGKEAGGKRFDERLEGVLVEMGIDRGTFISYLASHEEDLKRTLQCMGM